MFKSRKFCEWVGSLVGMFGAFVLAANEPWSGYGWLAFFVSNIAWIRFAVLTKTRSLLLMQMGFLITTIIGICRWLVL